MKYLIVLSLVFGGLSSGVYGEWRELASLNASAQQQEVAVGQPLSKIMITCSEGSVTVERVSVVSGDKTIPFQMNSMIAKGERQQITVGNHPACNKLLLLVTGQGRFEIKIRP